MNSGFDEAQVEAARETTLALVRRLFPETSHGLAELWDAAWQLAEMVRPQDMTRDELQTLMADGLGFADTAVEPGPTAVIGTVVFVVVGLGRDALEDAGPDELRSAVVSRGELWDLAPELGEAVTRSLKDDVSPAISAAARELVSSERRDPSGSLGMRRVVIRICGDKRVDDVFAIDRIDDVLSGYDTTSFPVRAEESARAIWLDGEHYEVRIAEVKFFVALLLAWNRSVEYDDLVEWVFGAKYLGSYDRKNVIHVKHTLCGKLGLTGGKCDKYIESVAGTGYKWVGPGTYLVICSSK